MHKYRFFYLLFLTLLMAGYNIGLAGERKTPVIYCCDLFHPHCDPDDHFDIATLYAIPEIDIKVIILDQNNNQGWNQDKDPGSVPISQMNYITNRNVPYAAGLSYKLAMPEDTGFWQPKKHQKGVELLLDTLKKSSEPVTVITVGSLRNVAAAYNRDPKLLREKISRLFAFVGEASKKGYVDYNIDLDINAYIRVMGSDLPVYWVPCFDGGIWQNNGNASYWNASHKDLLSKASDKTLNFFIYALLKKDKDAVDPVRYIDGEVDVEARDKIFAMKRHLWCSAVFSYVSGRKIIRKNGEFVSMPAETVCCPKQVVDLFTFKDVAIDVDRPVRILTDGKPGEIRKVKLFQITNKDIYQKAMTSITADLLSRLGTNDRRN